MGGAYIGHVAMHATFEDRTHGEKRPGVPHPGITPMGASCHSVVFRRNQKQILGRLTVFWGLAALPFVAPEKLLSTPDSSVAPSVVANAGGR